MKVFMKTVLGFLLVCTTVFAAETFDISASSLRAHLLSAQQLDVSGEFAQYDFANVSTAFDWTFTTANGTVYQLQGKAPSSSDVFGWKAVNVTPETTQWYMSYLGDWDGDGERRFDWVLVGNGSSAVYKLAGVSDEGTFEYSSKIDVPYTVSEDKSRVTFGDASTPQYSVSFPSTGDIVVKVTQDNGSDWSDFYAKNAQLYKISGSANAVPFEILYSDDKVSSYSIGDNKITYIYNNDGTLNYKLYVNDVFKFESKNISLARTVTKEDYEALMKEAGGNLFVAARLLRDRVLNSHLFGGLSGICDDTSPHYNPKACTNLYESAVRVLTHLNFNEDKVLQEVAQNAPTQDESDAHETDEISLKELYDYNSKYLDDLFIEFDQCPYDEPEHDYTYYVIELNAGTLYCGYKDHIISSYRIDPNDDKWGTRISVKFTDGEFSSITQHTETTQLTGTISDSDYIAFSLFEKDSSTSFRSVYSTNKVNSSDPNSDYVYHSYNSGVQDYMARYDKDFNLIQFCQYEPDGKSIAWCDPEF